MKYILIFYILLAIAFSSFSQGNDNKQEWIAQYKESVVFSGFLRGLDNSELSSSIMKADKSFYNPFFKTLHQRSIKRGTDYLVNLISKNFESRKGRVAQPAEGKQALLISLHFYTSKKLAEMAEEEFLKWINNPNKKILIEEVKRIY